VPAEGPERPDDEAADTERGPGRSTVTRIIAVLEALATTDGGVGPRSLERETGIDRSAISRLLRQLTELGMAAPADVPGRYAIGPRFFAIAGAVTSRDGLRRAARPALDALTARFNETSYVAVLEDGQVVYRDVIESTQPLRYVAELGIPSPLHAGAAGRAILAGLTDAELTDWLDTARLEQLTPGTIVDRDALLAQRQLDRARGYAVSRGERVPGGAAVAAPFLAASGEVHGSLVVSCPVGRLPAARETEIGRLVVVLADQLSWRLGAGPAADGGREDVAGSPPA